MVFYEILRALYRRRLRRIPLGPAQPNSPRPQLVPGCTLVSAVNDRCAKTGLDRYGTWQMAKPKIGQKSNQNQTKVVPKSAQNQSKIGSGASDIGYGAGSASRAVLDRFRTNFCWTFGPIWGHLEGQVGGMLGRKTDFSGFGRRLNMNTELKAFQDSFWTDFRFIFNARKE